MIINDIMTRLINFIKEVYNVNFDVLHTRRRSD